MSDVAPWREVPEGMQVNEFSGELEPKAPLSLNPDPAEQRILSNGPADKPLAELNDLFVKGLINVDGTPTDETQPEEVSEEVTETPEQEGEDNDTDVQTSSDEGTSEDAPEPA